MFVDRGLLSLLHLFDELFDLLLLLHVLQKVLYRLLLISCLSHLPDHSQISAIVPPLY